MSAAPPANGLVLSYAPSALGRLLLFALLLLLLAPVARADEAEDDEEENPFRPGIVATYTGSDAREHARLEEQIAFAWGDEPPDARLPRGPFTARYRGNLHVQGAGAYQLSVFAAGSVRLEVAGQVILDRASSEPAWLDAEPIELPFGYHAFELTYRRDAEPARLALYWVGPQFSLEPVADRWLFHPAESTPAGSFEEGRRLVRALRCGACHELPSATAPLPAPALDSLAQTIAPEWLVDWLAGQPQDPPAGESSSSRRMPHFGFSRDEAQAVAAYLASISQPLAPQKVHPPAPAAPPKKKKNDPEPPLPPPSAATGQALVHTLGCLACHRVGELGTSGPFGGGDLSHIANKRPADFFARWLVEPEALNRAHRMPVFALDAGEVASLSLYLQSLRGAPADNPATETGPAETIALGRRLVEQARCASCHDLPTSQKQAEATQPKLPLKHIAAEAASCLAEPDAAKHRPGYRLAAEQAAAVADFLRQMTALAHMQPRSAPPAPSGQEILLERNCLGCHARGPSPGLSASLIALAEHEPSLRDILPALAPPPLHSVGDKLHDEALVASITRDSAPRQTWLRVRMPKFPLSDAETAALVRHFVDTDRIPAGRSPFHPPSDEAALEAAGSRLVTADGFGCTSCHAIGKWQPQKVALNAAGANLSLIGQRVRHEWFNRWVRNPSRIVAGMEMPSVQQPVRGVLEGNLDRQLAAVWQVLNRKDFNPPSPSALRVVRRANLPDLPEPAVALTEVIDAGGRVFVKPLVVGLPNRHNVLFDLATNRLAGWWLGDAARQQTRGKTWYWEAGTPQLLAIDKKATGPADGELQLVIHNRRLAPTPPGEYVTEFDTLEHTPSGLRFRQRLRFEINGQPHVVRVAQHFSALPDAPPVGAGFRRTLQIENLPESAALELLVLPGDCVIDASGAATLKSTAGRLHATLRVPGELRLKKSPRGAILALAPPTAAPVRIELDYRCETLPDEFPPLPEADRSLTREVLSVVPGFLAERLPVTDQAMPTALAWREDGTLALTSLEGRVWLGRDSDGDGLEDRLAPFSDELAAPFGLAPAGNAIDVINKYGLLRLFDEDGDGRAERTELLASGWGHTRDYHDWAVGLPRDAEGNYYVSLPCQQDERSEAGAHLRGTVIKLTPREPTADDPRRYAIEPLAAGLRFPQGIARSSTGAVFVTDNQGNYTPFNELNHIRPSKRYGFINRLESKRGLNPPFVPAAVEIPHPWTRSVNGICFLDTPPEVSMRLGRDPFGPFAGHLVGCEYDTRRLVRISLQPVGDTFQGAVYPFSAEPPAGSETFEGPLSCAVSPRGDLYIGNIRDSGWGGGSNTGSLVRVRPTGELPPGVAEVCATPTGFTVDFTAPVDRARAENPASYSLASYRRVPTPAYGGPDQDRRVEKIKSVHLSDDARRVTLELDALREGFVYEFHLRPLVASGVFFPAEAYYTLRQRVQ